MIGIAFDLGRTAFVAFDEQARGDAAERHRGREEQRLAGDFFFRLAHVRNDQFLRLHRARGDAGERHRRAHQFQEAAAADRIEPLGRVARELAVQVVLELGRAGDFVEAAPHLRRARLLQLRAHGAKIDRRTGLAASDRDFCALGACFVDRSRSIVLDGRHRWHTEQLVKCSLSAILYSRTSCAPRSACATAGT